MGEDIKIIQSGQRTRHGSQRLEQQIIIKSPAKKSVSVSKETPWLKKLVLNRIRQYGYAELIYNKYGKEPTPNYSIPGYMSDAVKKWAEKQNLDIYYGANSRGVDTIKFAKKNNPYEK